MDGSRKMWLTPALVTLARGTQAETILDYCKLFSPLGGGGYDATDSGCWVTTCNTACQQHSSAS